MAVNNDSMVFVIQNPTIKDRPAFDFTPAEKFGPVEILLPNGKDVLTPDIFIEQVRRRLDEVEFDPYHDYLVAVGSPPVNLVLGALLAEFGRFTVLHWINSAKQYQPITYDINQPQSRRDHARANALGR
jgi:hypothetical protein